MKKWITLAALCLAFFFYMSDRQLFGLLVPLIQEETGMSKVQIGFIDTVLYWVVALMMPPLISKSSLALMADMFMAVATIRPVPPLWA